MPHLNDSYLQPSFSASPLSPLYIISYILPEVPIGIISPCPEADFLPPKWHMNTSSCQVLSLRHIGIGIAAARPDAQDM